VRGQAEMLESEKAADGEEKRRGGEGTFEGTHV
jgi:hypothetical protein